MKNIERRIKKEFISYMNLTRKEEKTIQIEEVRGNFADFTVYCHKGYFSSYTYFVHIKENEIKFDLINVGNHMF